MQKVTLSLTILRPYKYAGSLNALYYVHKEILYVSTYSFAFT